MRVKGEFDHLLRDSTGFYSQRGLTWRVFYMTENEKLGTFGIVLMSGTEQAIYVSEETYDDILTTWLSHLSGGEYKDYLTFKDQDGAPVHVHPSTIYGLRLSTPEGRDMQTKNEVLNINAFTELRQKWGMEEDEEPWKE